MVKTPLPVTTFHLRNITLGPIFNIICLALPPKFTKLPTVQSRSRRLTCNPVGESVESLPTPDEQNANPLCPALKQTLWSDSPDFVLFFRVP